MDKYMMVDNTCLPTLCVGKPPDKKLKSANWGLKSGTQCRCRHFNYWIIIASACLCKIPSECSLTDDQLTSGLIASWLRSLTASTVAVTQQ